MIAADAFAQGVRGVPLGTGDHAPLFRRVEARIERLRALPFARAVVYRMIDLVPEAERGRLPPAARGLQRAVRIPMDLVRVWIEVVDVVPVRRERNAVRAVFELAKHYGEGPLKIEKIATTQALPLQFLEGILSELKQAGFLVKSACNGQEALAAFDPQRHQVLVTDIVMPKLDGIGLTRKVCERSPALPVVLISGFSEETSVLQDLPQSNLCYLQKPFPVSRLVKAIRDVLAQAGARRAKE